MCYLIRCDRCGELLEIEEWALHLNGCSGNRPEPTPQVITVKVPERARKKA